MIPILAFILWMLSPAGGPAAWSAAPDCPELYANFRAQISADLSERQAAFLDEALLPAVGRRLLSSAGRPRACRAATDACLVFPSSSPHAKEVKIEWTAASGPTPWVEVSDTARTLKIPAGMSFAALPERGRAYVQQLLLGTDLHPYVATAAVRAERQALGESPLFLKASQEDAVRAISDADREGVRKQLLVSPTAWGKTEVLKAYLAQRLGNGGPKLHVVLADQNHLVQQLQGEAKALCAPARCRVLRWGGGSESAASVDDLLAEAARGDTPVVLVTTIHSFKAAVSRGGWDANVSRLRPALNTLVYDEAHHSGAPQAKVLIEGLVDAPGSPTALFGMTATPTHSRVGIQQFFDEGAHWAYLEKGATQRPVEQVVDQLSHAIQRGELTPFDRTYFVSPQSLGLDGSLFVTGAQGRRTLDPARYDALFKRMAPLFQEHRHGFIAVGTIEEANAVGAYLNRNLTGRSFAVLHSRLSAEERDRIQRLYKEGKIHFLVTVKYLDEGVRYPDMSLYVDLNRNVGSRQFLQRIGRVLALEPGKERVDVVSLMELDERGVREHLSLIDQVLAGKLQLPSPPDAVRASGAGIRPPATEPTPFSLNPEEMRAELVRLRTQLQSFWTGGGISPREVALSVADVVRRKGALPIAHTEDNLLYNQMLKVRERPEFLDTLRADPVAWKVFEWGRFSVEKRAGLEILDYIVAHGALPPSQGATEGLYHKLVRYRSHPDFVTALQTNPAAWQIYQRAFESTAHLLGRKLIELVESGASEIPAGSFRVMVMRYRKDPELVEALRGHPAAWKVFDRLGASAAKLAALDVIEFMRAQKLALPRTGSDYPLYKRFINYRNHPEFIETMQRYPEIWAAYQAALRK